jgi:two-component system LytT family response regulator
MFKTIVVDDEPINNDYLANLLREYCPSVEVVAKSTTVPDALATISKHNPHIVFLDIEIQDRNGFEILEAIDLFDVYVIILSAYEKYAIRAIRHNARDYILKPLSVEELVKAVNRYGQYYASGAMRDKETITNPSPKVLSIASKESVEIINIPDIVYLEARNTATAIFLQGNKKFVSSKPMKDLQAKLPDEQFLRIHKSYLVNVNHIVRYKKARFGTLVLSNGAEVPVAEAKKLELQKALNL